MIYRAWSPTQGEEQDGANEYNCDSAEEAAVQHTKKHHFSDREGPFWDLEADEMEVHVLDENDVLSTFDMGARQAWTIDAEPFDLAKREAKRKKDEEKRAQQELRRAEEQLKRLRERAGKK